jgi:hypothetical protein
VKHGDIVVNQLDWSSTLLNDALSATVNVSDTGIHLSVARAGTDVIDCIALGISIDGIDLSDGSRLTHTSERQETRQWNAHSGKSVGAHEYSHRELLLELAHAATSREWTIRIRLADDGVAVRYAIPDLQGLAQLTADSTAIDLTEFDRAWVLDYQTWYETPRSGVDIGELGNRDYGFPFLARRGDHYILVTESQIDGRNSGAHATIVDSTLKFAFADPTIEIARGNITPWRVFVVGSLPQVVETLLIDELANPEQPDSNNFSWVRPGRAAWSWWSDFYSGAQLEQQKRFVDAAAELSWEHLLIDCGWDETWVPEIVAYASQRGIQVHLWTVWHDLDGPEKLNRLALWRSWGVAGIKVDFMESEHKDRYRWYDSVLQETARLGLMVNFHGSVIPRGWARTWPQVIGYEAIRGSEYYVFYNDTPLTAAHNVIQPFTRNVVGAMDYTPVAFSAPGRETSDGHELALSVVFECGITHYADDVAAYLGRPLVARFLSELAPMWDESLLLSGTPDTEAVIARRQGHRWFIGVIATGPARTITVPLHRLQLRDATAWIVTDASGGRDLVNETRPATHELRVDVAENGGFVAIVSQGELFRGVGGRVATAAPHVSPSIAQLNSDQEAVLETSINARLRVAPGWSATEYAPGTWRVRAPRDIGSGQLGVVTVEATGGDIPAVAHARLFAPLDSRVHLLSELPMLSFTNQSGPIERNMSNGGGNPMDGLPMRVAGAEFNDGFGVSTPSTFNIRLGGVQGHLSVQVGVDDETPSTRAWATVLGDGIELASALVNAGERSVELVADLSGIQVLTLSTREVVEGDNPAHVDWASARLTVNPTVGSSNTPNAGHR